MKQSSPLGEPTCVLRLQEKISGTGLHIGTLGMNTQFCIWTWNCSHVRPAIPLWKREPGGGRLLFHVATHCQHPGGGYDVSEQLCHWLWAAHTHAHKLHTCQLCRWLQATHSLTHTHTANCILLSCVAGYNPHTHTHCIHTPLCHWLQAVHTPSISLIHSLSI